MTYMVSTASNNGIAQIVVYFEQNYDPDIAAVNVQNRVALANPLLPQEVLQTGVSTRKQQTDALMFFDVYSTNPALSDIDISNYLQINIVPDLQRINGAVSYTHLSKFFKLLSNSTIFLSKTIISEESSLYSSIFKSSLSNFGSV